MKKKIVQGKMFLSPKSDVAFKELMRNETVLRHFISDVLGIPPEEIREVQLENTFLPRRSRRDQHSLGQRTEQYLDATAARYCSPARVVAGRMRNS